MKKRLFTLLLAMMLLLSACSFPIHDGKGNQIDVSNEERK